jgi:glutathione synthase/RimK-type ligase-like ATP-grasp enzyme
MRLPDPQHDAVIVLWGLTSDGPLAAVLHKLHDVQAPIMVLDQRDVLATEVRLTVGTTVRGSIRLPDTRIDIKNITAVYLRPHDSGRLPAIRAAGADSAEWRHAKAIDGALWRWSEIAPALVVNRPSAMAIGASKPRQLRELRHFGFAVPETLITTCPDAAHAFWVQHRDVIYKSISGIRSRVSRLQPDHLDRLADVASCPTQFQRFIPGRDFRVHVVGQDVFTSEVVADVDDYRYPEGQPVTVRPSCLPPRVEEQCRHATAGLGLHVAGIDLRRTPTGEWYCFEVNPSPAFTYYEERTGQRIGQAIARLLEGARPG